MSKGVAALCIALLSMHPSFRAAMLIAWLAACCRLEHMPALQACPQQLLPLPLYAALPPDDQLKAFKPAPANTRKVPISSTSMPWQHFPLASPLSLLSQHSAFYPMICVCSGCTQAAPSAWQRCLHVLHACCATITMNAIAGHFVH